MLAEPTQGLLQTHLGGLCSQWSLSAAIGTWVACECVRAEGMEDAGAVKGVEKVVSCHKSSVLGIKWVGQVVESWGAWLLLKGCVVPNALWVAGSRVDEVCPTQLERSENLSAHR